MPLDVDSGHPIGHAKSLQSHKESRYIGHRHGIAIVAAV